MKKKAVSLFAVVAILVCMVSSPVSATEGLKVVGDGNYVQAELNTFCYGDVAPEEHDIWYFDVNEGDTIYVVIPNFYELYDGKKLDDVEIANVGDYRLITEKVVTYFAFGRLGQKYNEQGFPYYEYTAKFTGKIYISFMQGTNKTDKLDYRFAVGTANPDVKDLGQVNEFVTRMYNVCLGRTPDSTGLNDWVNKLVAGERTGSEVAYGFVFSAEFQNKNLCNEDYVKALYKAFLGREYDQGGLDNWVKLLESGKTREEVFNGFAQSNEFRNLCGEYGIVLGNPIPIPTYGTTPTGACTVCGKQDGVTEFVTRLYNVCLDRTPDAGGLSDWSGQLKKHTKSGTDVAFGFVFSNEFQNKGLSDEEYVEYMYKAFFGRPSDAAGKADWVGRLKNGSSRNDIFDGFTGSAEFDNLCAKYGIKR